MSVAAPGLPEDPRFERLLNRGGLLVLPLAAPDAWPHGALATDEKERAVGDDRLSASYCTVQGHRFLRAHLLLPLTGARTVFAFAAWGSVSEETWAAWLAARAGGKAFSGAFAWLANRLPGFDDSAPVPCNLTAGPPGALPRLQPQPGNPLAQAQAEGIDPGLLATIYAAAGIEIETLLDE